MKTKMTEFYKQYFCPEDEAYSLIIEDDGKVAYAYLFRGKEVVGDIWLYNQMLTPESVNWKDKESMPFLNPIDFVERDIEPLSDSKEISLKWKYGNEFIEVEVYIRKEFIALLKPYAFPGWSLLVKKDGPLAKKYLNETEAKR